MEFLNIFLGLLVLYVGIVDGNHGNPIVKTSLGKIEGYWTKSVSDKAFAAFDGIPYAEPPVNENRFEESKPVKSWVGVWQANTIHKCLQYNHYTEPNQDYVIGQEDCLYLNVYTPKLDPSAMLDVIIYIHGGGFMWNSASAYGPNYIMNRDVVYVNLNYRLGPLGFLSTEDATVPGNNGLKDQLLALKWIKQEIRNFGGNPDSMTLTGMSAGGASVQLHFLSPLSTGIFHRGMSQSGTALNPWVLMENSLEKAKKIACIVGCDTKDTKLMIKCMKRRPGRQIVAAVKSFLPWLYNPFSPFGVVVDKWSKTPFLPEHPYKLLTNKNTQQLPLIFSSVQAEGLYPAADFIADSKYLETIEEKWNSLLPFILDFNGTVDAKRMDDVSQKIKKQYFGEKQVTVETFNKLVKMISDRMFNVDIEKAARLHSSINDAPVYYYYFSYRGTHSQSEIRALSNENYGTSHADDTVYVLSGRLDFRSTDTDVQMSELFLDLWTSYAKNGIPKINDVNWKPMSKELSAPLDYLHIRSPSDIKMENSEDMGNKKFWNSLPIKENEKLFTEKIEL